jgi:Icc-related predicted phosphoesterase
VTLGDNDYTRGRSFRANWVSSFGWLGSSGVDVAGTLGNHDVEFGRGRYEFALLRMPGPYYVRRVKDVELIVLDSNAITMAQTRWLNRTLANRSGFRRIVVFHHPPYTCGGHLGSATVRRAWVPLFERYGVRLVLTGHDHNYQRFARNGVTYVVHGGGGAGLYKLRACPRGYPRRLAARVGHGFLHLTVAPDGVAVEVLDLAGIAIDRFRVT